MKKQIVLGMLALCLGTGAAFAQDASATSAQPQGRMPMKQPNERAKEYLLQMSQNGISDEKCGKAYEPIFQYFTAQQKAMEDMRASGTFDREAMKAKRDELIATRNKQLAAILSEPEMKKFLDMEADMRAKAMQERGGRQ